MKTIVAAALLAVSASAYAQSDLSEGLRLYTQKGNCQACHGWSGDGRKMDNQMPDGPSLRDSKLDREAVALTIKCGRPGRSMPAFDRFAYSDGRCYGMKEADLQASGQTLFDPPATLQAREIETLVNFLFARVIGQGPMTRAKCAEYWGGDGDVCRELK